MDTSTATLAFAALSQPTRLDVFRLLIKAGTEGMQAGDIATKLGVKQNTMSTNLSVLHRAGLIRNQREGRAIRYFADFDGMQGLLRFLMQDCCGGRPQTCQPIIESITCEV